MLIDGVGIALNHEQSALVRTQGQTIGETERSGDDFPASIAAVFQQPAIALLPVARIRDVVVAAPVEKAVVGAYQSTASSALAKTDHSPLRFTRTMPWRGLQTNNSASSGDQATPPEKPPISATSSTAPAGRYPVHLPRFPAGPQPTSAVERETLRMIEPVSEDLKSFDRNFRRGFGCQTVFIPEIALVRSGNSRRSSAKFAAALRYILGGGAICLREKWLW